MRLRHGILSLLGLLGLVALSPIHVQAQVTAAPSLMNFQGRLAKPDGTPVADGTYSVRFSLWNAVSAGTETWNQTLASVAVRNGTFAVQLSGFPANTFNGNQWLEIKIGTDTPLTPRQPLVSVPYALKANSVPDGSIGAAQIANGTITADKFAPNTFNPLAWLLGGNSGTNSATQFLGTTDNQPLVFKVNAKQAMRYSYTENTAVAGQEYRSINLLGGSEINGIVAGVVGATIAGGGYDAFSGDDFPNRVTGYFGTVGGGLGNRAGDITLDNGYYTTVGGGGGNTASGGVATVAGGYGNTASGNYSIVPGGFLNTAAGNSSFAAGQQAQANHNGSFVWNDSTNAGDFTTFFTSTAPNQFLIHATGGVGIGTNTPIAQLDIRGGNGSVGAPAFIVGGLNGAQGQRAIAGLWSTFMNVPADTTARRTADIVAGFNGGAWGTEYLAFNVGNNSAANDASALTSEKLRVTANGNVGIGTFTPGAKLDVNGTTQMTGFKLSTGAGANKVLTSDASGMGTWNVLTSLLGNDSITNAMIQSVDYSKITNAPSGGSVWSLTGNAGTNPASNFIGTTDNQPLMFQVNNRRAMQYEYVSTPAFESVNVVGGSPINSLGLYVKGVTIAGGGQDNISGTDFPNRVVGDFGTVGGGRGNLAFSDSTVAGGKQNVSNFFATVGGGVENNAGYSATIGGGFQNIASGDSSFIGGGFQNSATSKFATVAGGVLNNASGERATLVGGTANTASGFNASIGGGAGNFATGDYATIPGGINNTAAGINSFAAGQRANASHPGSFVWADASNTADFASTADYQFNIRAAGGTRIFSNAGATTGVLLAAGGGSWSSASDRNLKTNFQNVDTLDVLEKLIAMPLTTWNYKASTDIRHIGPMAQEFYAAFGGLGMDDKHIDTVDADGVAFAAIQGLNRKLEAKLEVKEQRLQKVEAENAELKARLEALELAVARLTAQPK